MCPKFGRHDRVACSRVNGDLDLVPLRRTHDADRTLAHLREQIQSSMGLNVLVDMKPVGFDRLIEANYLVGMFRSDAMALLHVVDLVGDQLHREIVEGW